MPTGRNQRSVTIGRELR